jgi:hypothetical protein
MCSVIFINLELFKCIYIWVLCSICVLVCMLMYLCPVLSMCSTNFDLTYGWLIAFISSSYLAMDDLPVCPI